MRTSRLAEGVLSELMTCCIGRNRTRPTCSNTALNQGLIRSPPNSATRHTRFVLINPSRHEGFCNSNPNVSSTKLLGKRTAR
eukprot:jgi/Mesvir1/27590/Mv26395-RA.1